MDGEITIRGARQNNLKGVDVSIPRRTLTALTGPSGSGKSSLAFDTVYAEGQRRYVESLSTYAKQFLDRMRKPDLDSIDGVSPAVAIDQRNAVKTSRSSVGTVTEVYDYMRLLWARVGVTWCPDCQIPVRPDTVQSASARVLELDTGTRAYVAFPLVLSAKISTEVAVANIQAQGYLRVLIDGEELYLPEVDESVDLAGAGELLVVVDRIAVGETDRERLADSIAAAFAEGGGRALVVPLDAEGGHEARLTFSEMFRCSSCGRESPEPRPALFSFNSPAGACPRCTGFGATLEYDESLIVPDVDRSLADGAIDPWAKPRYRNERALLRIFAARRGVDMSAPWCSLPEEIRSELLHGSPELTGVLPFLRSKERKKYKPYIRVFLRQYQLPRTCPDCGGTRLRAEALEVRVDGKDIAGISRLTVGEHATWLAGLTLAPFEAKVAASIRTEIQQRLEFLDDVGLGYLTLDRQARTLSGGEMQRIRLASCLGSHLVDTLYVLDEPTIGLHPRDIDRFLDVLGRLKERGNTVLMVEHEPRALARAEHLIELGPGSGHLGGEIVFEGDWQGLLAADTQTGRALSGRDAPPERKRRAGGGARLTLRGATLHNVRGLDVDIPLGALVAVTGVSGSGKSTLVHDILYRALEAELRGESSAKRHLGEVAGTYRSIDGIGRIDKVVLVDQSPIGRTPRSNPITYIRAFAELRRLYAALPEARRRSLEPGDFSFNRPGGRCEICKGAGEETVEMVFMADVTVPCEACEGQRYRPEILAVDYRGLDIRQALDLTVDEAIRFFIHQDRLGQALWQLQRVGLGYLRLGQPATTLSGGEAQRLKIARELAHSSRTGQNFYIMDEPTVGLGLGEISTLMRVLDQLVGEGHTVVIVEHNLDLIARADWVIDLGPDAADRGGRLVAAGTPEQVAGAAGSHTGDYLRRHLAGEDVTGPAGSSQARPA